MSYRHDQVHILNPKFGFEMPLRNQPNFFFMSSIFLRGSDSRSTCLRTAVITSFVLHCVTPSHKSFSSFFVHFFGGSDSPGRNGCNRVSIKWTSKNLFVDISDEKSQKLWLESTQFCTACIGNFNWNVPQSITKITTFEVM